MSYAGDAREALPGFPYSQASFYHFGGDAVTLTTFQRGSASISADVSVDRAWALPSTGQPGQATIRVPYSSVAASATYIRDDGGSWVEVASVGGCGKWIGIVRKVQHGDVEYVITAEQPWTLLRDQIIHVSRTNIHSASFGTIALVVLREALSGLPWFYMGAFDEGSDPLTQGYSMDGDAWSILTNLMDQGVNELFINAETGYVTWGGALAGAQLVATELFAGGNFHGAAPALDGTQVASEVMATRGEEHHSVYSGTAAGVYPGKVVVSVSSGGSLERAARAELTQRSKAAVSLAGGVGTELWSIRERNYVNVSVPIVNFTGRSYLCRVLARSIEESANLMQLSLQVIEPSIGVRVAPPSRGGGGSIRMSTNKWRGSFRQRNQSVLARVWSLIRAHNDAN